MAAGALPILGAITLLGLGLRLFNLGTHPLWLDEALSLHFARLPWYELLTSSSTSDPNPHFYFLLLKGWSMLGESEFLLRLLSALAGTLVIPLTFAIATQLADRSIGLLAAALVATSDLQLRYSQEVRPYAIMTLAAALAIWGLLHLLQRRPTLPGPGTAGEVQSPWERFLPWLAYTGGTAIALHTHNSMILLLACSNGIALASRLTWGKWERGFTTRWLAANVAILILWSPALLMTVHKDMNVLDHTWLDPISARAAAALMARTYASSSGSRWFMLLLMTLAAAGAWSWRRRPRALAFTLPIAAGVPLLAYLSSFWWPLMLQRTLLWPALMATILVAAGCYSLKFRPAILAVVALLLTVQGVADYRLYQRDHRAPWDQVARFVEDGLQKGDVVVIAPSNYRHPFLYYFANSEPPAPVFGFAHGDQAGPQQVVLGRGKTPDILSPGHRVWLVLNESSPGRGPVARDALAAVGTIGARQRFGSVDVICFVAPPADPPPGT